MDRYQTPFSLSLIPTELQCPDCGHYIRDVDLAEGFELLVASVLQGKVAGYNNPGYDVYGSALFPDKTFQVKYARSRIRPAETKLVNGRLCEFAESVTWTWSEPVAGGADYYVLFGVQDGLVMPFCLPQALWLDVASDDGNGGKLRTTTATEFSKCGRYASSYKRNTFWRHSLGQWPCDLLDRIEYYLEYRPLEQSSF